MAQSPQGTQDHLLMAMVDAADHALILHGPDGTILRWNLASERLLGHPSVGAIGRHIGLVWPRARRAELQAVMDRLLQGSPTESLSTELLHRDGTSVPVDLQLRAVREGQLTRAVAIRAVSPGVKPPPAPGHQADTQLRTLTLAIEQSPAAVVITDVKGQIEYVNRRFSEISGYEAAEVVGQTPRLLKSGHTPPEEYARLWGTILRGEVWRGQLCNRRKNGELYWHSASISPLRDETGNVVRFVAVQEDVTAQRQVLEALRASEAGFRRIVETASEGIWQVDAEHRTTFVNARLAEMLGYTEQEMLGRSVFDFTDEEGRRIAERSLERRRQGIREQLDFKLQRRDRSTLWVLMSTGPILDAGGCYAGALAMVTDMTSRRAAEEAVRTSEAYFRALIGEALDLISVLDREGRFSFVSPSHERILGYRSEELLGTPGFALLHPEDVEAISGVFEEGMKTPRLVRSMQFRVRHRDGSWRVLEGIGRSLFDDPIMRGVVINARDVTERLALEAQFRQAHKMEAVGRLAGGVVHDFNNVLGAILGFSTLLLEDLPEDHPSRPDVEEVRKAAERGAALNRQLLAFSRQQVLLPRILDLNVLIGDIEGMLARLLREDITLETQLTPEPAVVLADPTQIEQILINLAVNSRDAMPTGGRLVIETATTVLTEQWTTMHRPMPAGTYVMLSVSDTGTGMDEATRMHAFEPFFSTKGEGKGTGLGLSTVYGIVKQSGGFVWLYSEPGHGTVAKIYLPKAAGDAPGPGAVVEPEELGGTETLIVAEDNPAVLLLVQRALERQGYTVLGGTGPEVLELARRHAVPPRLLLTDVIMPTINGPDLAVRLREFLPALRVVYMSGFTGNAAQLDGVREGRTGFLQKPFTPAALARKVREVLDQSVG
jgi:PAS domain S-box-containing protein